MRTCMLIGLLCVLAGGAVAQPLLGDIVVNDKKTLGHVLYLDRSAGQLLTIAAGPISANRAVGGLSMAKDNTNMLLLEEGGPGFYLWNVTPNGVVTTVAPASVVNQGPPTSIDLMQDGRYAVTAAVFKVRDYLRIFDPATKTLTSIYTHSPSTQYFYGVRENPDNGNLLVNGAFGSQLFECNPVTATLRTIYTGLGNNHCVDVDPATGNYIVGTYTKINVISPAGKLVTTFAQTYVRRLRVESSTGNIICVTGATGGAVNKIVELDRQGVVIKTHGPYTGYNFTGLDIYGSRTVTGSGPATPGSSYKVDFMFPGLPGLTYVAALSLSRRSGIKLQGSTLHLMPDGLFFASLQGLFVSGFQGTLDATGHASGSIQIPAFVPRGVTIFCSAIATNGKTILTGNSIGITVR